MAYFEVLPCYYNFGECKINILRVSFSLVDFLVTESHTKTSFFLMLQISEVVNSMKDLIDYSREVGTGPMGKLNFNYPINYVPF